MLTATVSGSFHRHLSAIESAVRELVEAGVRVLSPADPRVVDSTEEFLFVASDRVRSVRLVQDRHLESIRASDFLWLVAPDGYVGQSASMEVGFAVANGTPILGLALPSDLTLRQYVHQVPDLRGALRIARGASTQHPRPEPFVIDPHASIEAAHVTLQRIAAALGRAQNHTCYDPAPDVYAERLRLLETMALPARGSMI